MKTVGFVIFIAAILTFLTFIFVGVGKFLYSQFVLLPATAQSIVGAFFFSIIVVLWFKFWLYDVFQYKCEHREDGDATKCGSCVIHTHL